MNYSITSDSITLYIYKNSEPFDSITYNWEETYDGELTLEAPITVDSLDNLKFRVFSETNVDWSSVSWKPNVYYIESFSSSNNIVSDQNGNPIYSWNPAVEYTAYTEVFGATIPHSIPNNGITNFTPVLTLKPNNQTSGQIIFTAKLTNELLHKQVFTIRSGSNEIQENPITQSIIGSPSSDGNVFFEYHADDPAIIDAFEKKAVSYGSPNQEVVAGCYALKPIEEQAQGLFYRNWGQFIYNDPSPENAIDTLDLEIGTSLGGGLAALLKRRFMFMTPNVAEKKWEGPDDDIYIQGDVMSSARLGENDLSIFSSIPEGEGVRAVIKKSKTNGGYATGSFLASGNVNATFAAVQSDFTDMNGDRYPDNVESKIQYTSSRGKLRPAILDATQSNTDFTIQQSLMISTGLSFGVPIASVIRTTTNEGKVNHKMIFGSRNDAKASIGLSGSIGGTTDRSNFNLMDINGDGLLDRVRRGSNREGVARMNIGYSFLDSKKWKQTEVRNGGAFNYGGGLGVNITNGSVSAGISLSRSENEVEQSLIDVNGDGLIDYVENRLIDYDENGGIKPELKVYLNTGNGFSRDSIIWKGATRISEGISVGESANGAFTIGIPLPFKLKVCVNPSGGASENADRQTEGFHDVNGDGYPDYVVSNDEDEFKVKLSKIGRTNKLKSVSRPLKSSFAVDYKRVGNTYEQPNSIWTLSEVTTFDGFEGDGADYLKTSFVYEDGYYDRHEREFYGFKTVISHQLDTDKKDEIYRSTVQTFINDNYYEKGLVEREVIQDGAGNKYTESTYEYALKDVRPNSAATEEALKKSDDAAAFAAMEDMKQYFYEGQATAQKATRMTTAFDRIGNVIRYKDFGDIEVDGTDPQTEDNYQASIIYHNVAEKYIVGIPKEIVVTDETGSQTFRKRSTTIDDTTGDITEISQYVDADTSAVTNMKYDDFGNLERIERPKNHKGERLSFVYEYDEEVQTYPTKVTDGYGHISTSDYDVRFGVVTKSTDINGHEINYTIDDVGRYLTILGPYEQAIDTSYTIKFAYEPDADIPYATTQHFDPQHPDDPIETVTFIDGLTRVLQIKKDASIFVGDGQPDAEKRIVSGRVIFDAFGRTVESYYPVEEKMSIAKSEFNFVYDTITPTRTTFDILDRTDTVMLPDSATTSMAYNFGVGADSGILQFLTKVTDANGVESETFTNVRGLTTFVHQYPRAENLEEYEDESKDLWTQYRYNAINELKEVEDDGGNIISSKYDWLGRREERNHPDYGISTYGFDMASNLISKQTANIKAVDTEAAIEYSYDKERLEGISYPIDDKLNVVYEYGKVGNGQDSLYNRLGRVSFQADATGTQIFSYDRLGEVIRNQRTIDVIEGRGGRTFTTRWKYDTWNRLTAMVYPDGEEVSYIYNKGGKLDSLKSAKFDIGYNYINQLGYDKFEQRVFCAYGNGTKTAYQYDPYRRRLDSLRAVTASNEVMMNNKYRYDKLTNITSIKNNATIVVNDLGGPAEQRYEYDDYYRLTHGEGYWGNADQVQAYFLDMEYNNLHDIKRKKQNHLRTVGRYLAPYSDTPVDWDATFSSVSNWQMSNQTTHDFPYKYENKDGKPHAASQIGPIQYEYDANGNLLAEKDQYYFGRKRTYEWDEEDRLKSIDHDECVHEYRYDADDMRVIKRAGTGSYTYINGDLVYAGDSEGEYTVYVNPYMVLSERGYTKHFFIEGQRVVTKIGTGGRFGLGSNWGDWDNWREWDAWDNWANEDNWDKWYSSGDWPNDIQNDYRTQEETFQFYYHSDHLGSTGYITDIDGEVQQHIEYMPFGETFIQEYATNDISLYLFNGKELDAETGLYYYGARYYNPTTARWLSVDPLAEKYQGWSPYHYTYNSPINYIDPDGREIYLQVHNVIPYSIDITDNVEVQIPIRHASILIIPKNQSKYLTDKRFKTNKDGKRYTTIGGGPGLLTGDIYRLGKLQSGIKREADADLSTKRETKIVDTDSMNEDDLIDNLFRNTDNFSFNYENGFALNYDLFPKNLGDPIQIMPGDGYNSNSFASGLLESVGLKPPGMGSYIPGYDKPVPNSNFEIKPKTRFTIHDYMKYLSSDKLIRDIQN